MKNINKQTLHFIRLNFNQVQHKLLNKYSPAESRFVELLKELGVYYRRERGKYRRGQVWCYYDFFLPYYRLYVEIDGKEHENKEVRAKDRLKEKYVANNQSFVARFTNDEVMAMDKLTIEMLEEKVVEWLKIRHHKQHTNRHDRYLNQYRKSLREHWKQSMEDMKEDGLVEIDMDKPIYLYDHYIGEFYQFDNIVEAKQNIKEFTLPQLHELIYDFEYKRSNQRRFVLAPTPDLLEQRIAQVYY